MDETQKKIIELQKNQQRMLKLLFELQADTIAGLEVVFKTLSMDSNVKRAKELQKRLQKAAEMIKLPD
jgi:hypothetical protein